LIWFIGPKYCAVDSPWEKRKSAVFSYLGEYIDEAKAMVQGSTEMMESKQNA